VFFFRAKKKENKILFFFRWGAQKNEGKGELCLYEHFKEIYSNTFFFLCAYMTLDQTSPRKTWLLETPTRKTNSAGANSKFWSGSARVFFQVSKFDPR